MDYFIVKKTIIGINHYFICSDNNNSIIYDVKNKKISFPIKESDKIKIYEIFVDKFEKLIMIYHLRVNLVPILYLLMVKLSLFIPNLFN